MITTDEVWSGVVIVYSDVLVPEGVTLTIMPGTTVLFAMSDSSKIEPMFLSMGTELLIRGTLIAKGEEGKTITFRPYVDEEFPRTPAPGDWGGVIIDGQAASKSVLSGAELTLADSAVAVYNSSPVISGISISDSRYGFVFMGNSSSRVTGCVVTDCEFGMVASHGASPALDGCRIEKNEHDILQKEQGP